MDQKIFTEIFKWISNNPNFYFTEYRGDLILTIYNKLSYNLRKMPTTDFISLVKDKLLLCQTDKRTFINYNFIDFIEVKISGKMVVYAHRNSQYTLSASKLGENKEFLTEVNKKFMNYIPKNSSVSSIFLINTKNIKSTSSQEITHMSINNNPFIETTISFKGLSGNEKINFFKIVEEPGKAPFKEVLNDYLKTKFLMEEL